MLEGGELWVGPFQIRELLEKALAPNAVLPPEIGSAYLVTRNTWGEKPEDGEPLYVGGITGESLRFRTRIGDLLADMFGFYTETTGHHSGGQKLHKWCRDAEISPFDLYIAWVENTECHRCLEVRLHQIFNPELNRKRPSHCEKHNIRHRR